MKLLVVLSVIAIGYADKLDRTYLPPRNAATAGGSPGALTAPGIQPGPAFGQGLPSGSGSQPGTGFTQTGTSGFGQGPSGSVQPSNGFGSSNNGVPSGNGFGYSKTGASAPGTSYDSAFESRIPSASSGFGSSPSGANQAGVGQPATSPFDQGFEQGALGPNAAQEYTPERAQASADRSAEILKYINENNGDSYRYSYETSNGISAEEAGEATNGVRAQGGYSYTGDDGAAYSVTYTADENGYQPQGEHLPTPHPIPEEILKSIEENARAAAAGTQEGAYRPEEYDSEVSPQQYNTGATSFNQPQGQNSGSIEDFQSGQVINRPQSNQYSASQDQFPQRSPSGPSDQYGQENQGASGQFNGKVSAGLGQTTQGQGQGANGYTYKQPQNAFGSSGFGQGQSSQYRPQTNGQGPTSYSAGSSSTGSGSNGNQGASAPSFGNGRPIAPSFSPSQTQTNGQRPTSYSAGSSSTGSGSNGNQGASAPSFGNGRPSAPSYGPAQTQYQAGLGQFNLPSGNQAGTGGTSNQGQQYQSSFGSPQGSQYRPGNKPFGSAGPTGQGNQYQTNANQNAFGGINGASQGNQNGGSSIGQSQSQYGSKPSASSNGLGQTSFTGNQNAQSSRPSGRGPQYQQNGKQPAYGSDVGPSQGASPFGSGNQGLGSGAAGSAGTRDSQPIQAPYQYNRPGQSFDAQPQRPGFNTASQGSNGIPSQGNQRGTEQFGGPRQPPSFSPQEGYKY